MTPPRGKARAQAAKRDAAADVDGENAAPELDDELLEDELDADQGDDVDPDDVPVLADTGVASIDYERRRHGMSGAGFVASAAAAAEEARGAGGSDLVILAVAPGRLREVTELLTTLGASRGV